MMSDNADVLPPEIKFIQRGWYNANHIVIQNEGGPILIDFGPPFMCGQNAGCVASKRR